MGRGTIDLFKSNVDKAWKTGIEPYEDIIQGLQKGKDNADINKAREEIVR